MSSLNSLDAVKNAIVNFGFDPNCVELKPFGSGHINNTYKIITVPSTGAEHSKSFVIQKINVFVFKKPFEVMDNSSKITSFISKKIAENGCTENMSTALEFLSTTNGSYCYMDADNGYWRMYRFVDGICKDTADSPELMYSSGRAFGDFFMFLSDYPVETLFYTIPDFHNTPARFVQFKQAIKNDLAGRVSQVGTEINWVLERENEIPVLQNLHAQGILPIRVTHNDTKLNNVLLDKNTEKGLCIIDLDTVMPGFVAHDFGDAIRFGASTCAEDEVDLTKCSFDISMFESFANGFMESAKNALTHTEIETLSIGARIITLEQAIRFLADYINGDIYYKTVRKTQNLERARTQFRLLFDMEKQWVDMQSIISKLSGLDLKERI